MSFIQREIERLHSALLCMPNGPKRAELYAAQQSLAWALEPTGYRSPHDMIMDTPAAQEDCLAEPRPAPSSGMGVPSA